MNTEATISHLAADGMPAEHATAAWSCPEGMDETWDTLADLLSDVQPVAAEWVGGNRGLLLSHTDSDLGLIASSFRPIL